MFVGERPHVQNNNLMITACVWLKPILNIVKMMVSLKKQVCRMSSFGYKVVIKTTCRLKVINNTHIFVPYILVIPIIVLSGWKLNCDWLILFWNLTLVMSLMLVPLVLPDGNHKFLKVHTPVTVQGGGEQRQSSA